MLWFDRHSRFRDRLSAYIDGELDATAAERLEAHLAGCGRCRTELEELRATVTALRGLPQAEAPRSFALTREQAGVRHAPRPAPPLGFGMRVAAAGVAVALAAVVLVDLGGVGGDGVSEDAAVPQMMAERRADEAGLEAGGPETGAAAPEGELMSDRDAAETPAADGTGAGFTGEAAKAVTPAAGPEEAEAPAATPSGDGIDALTAAEIGLASALGLLVAGSLALAYAGRKR